MDLSTFKVLVQVVKREETSEKKLAVIGRCLRGAEYISAYQTAELIRLMPTDDDQLEVAQMAYQYNTDSKIYASVVGDSMKSASAREQLNQFIIKK